MENFGERYGAFGVNVRKKEVATKARTARHNTFSLENQDTNS